MPLDLGYGREVTFTSKATALVDTSAVSMPIAHCVIKVHITSVTAPSQAAVRSVHEAGI